MFKKKRGFTPLLDNVLKQKQRNINDFYLFGEEFGKGSFGTVYKAINKETVKLVAIKVIYKKKSFTSTGFLTANSCGETEVDMKKKQKYKVDNEITIHSSIMNHKNVVHLRDKFEDDEALYLVMDLVAGGTLRKFVNHEKRKPCMAEIWYIFKQMLEAVEHMHSYSVAHRDLKPANILLTNYREVKITDFGVSIQIPIFEENVSDFVAKEKSLGSGEAFAFYSPQRASSKRKYCPFAADMWALGIILYYMVSEGELLFKGMGLLGLLKKIESANYKFSDKVNSLDKDLLDLLHSLLKKEESSRLTAHKALKHPWIIYNEKKFTKEIVDLNEKLPLLKEKDIEKMLSFVFPKKINCKGKNNNV